MYESNKLCMLKLEEKITRSFKTNKSNFINVVGDKWEKLKINNFIL